MRGIVEGHYLCFSFCLNPVNLTGNATSCTKHPLFYVTKMVIT